MSATFNDQRLIAQDPSFGDMVRAAIYDYVLWGGAPNSNFNITLMANFSVFWLSFNWGCATNSTLSNAIITNGNSGDSFATSTPVGSALVTAAVQAGLNATDLSNAVASIYSILAANS